MCVLVLVRFKKSISLLAEDQILQRRIERTKNQSRAKEEKTKERVNKQIGIIDKKETEEPESQTLNRPMDAENAMRQPHRQPRKQTRKP